MEIKLIKKPSTYVSEADGKEHKCYDIYVVIYGVEVKIKCVFKNQRSLLSTFATLVEE